MADEGDDVGSINTNSLIKNDLENYSRHEQVEITNSEDAVRIFTPMDVISDKKKQSRCQPCFGIGFAILSTFAVVMINVLAKLCTVIPVFEIGIVRFVTQLAITIPFLIYANDKIVFSPKITLFLILRGFSGTSAVLTRLYAVQNMPLGDATVLSFTTPVFVAILGRIFLKEPLNKIYIFLLFLCLTGVVLIARPTFIFGHPDKAPEYENIWLPSLLAVSSAICAAFSLILIRILGRHLIKSSVIIFYLGIVGFVYSICCSYFDRGFQFPFCQSIDYLFAIVLGIIGSLLQAALNAALTFEKAFIVSLVRTSGIVIGFILQVIVFALIPSNLSFGGAALITLSNLIIFLIKWMKSKKVQKYAVRQQRYEVRIDNH